MIRPAFDTLAEAPLPVNRLRAPRNSASVMPSVEATKPPPTLTVPVPVMAMPLGLIRKTTPVALSWPAMVEGVLPVTRFRIAELTFGWLMLTVLGWPIEKEFQLTIAFCDDWVMVSTRPELPMMTAPVTSTKRPDGG